VKCEECDARYLSFYSGGFGCRGDKKRYYRQGRNFFPPRSLIFILKNNSQSVTYRLTIYGDRDVSTVHENIENLLKGLGCTIR